MGDYAHPDMLVSTDWVAEHAGDANVRIVEVDVDTEEYGKGHIAGAIGWSWQTQLCDTVQRDIISKADLEKLMGASGISNDTTIILYGDNNNWFAAWALWQLKVYGHKDARLMNGGRKKWLEEGRALSTDAPSHSATESVVYRRSVTFRDELSGQGRRQLDPGVPAGGDLRRGEQRGRAGGRTQPARVHWRSVVAPRLAGDMSARRPHSRRQQHHVGQGV